MDETTRKWAVVLCLCLLFPADRVVAQYVELTAQIETVFWSAEGVSAASRTARCVVGKNTWLIETDLDSQKHTWLFTGSNLIQHTLITGYPSKHRDLYERNHPEQRGSIGRKSTRVFESVDGNPGRPVRVADLGMPTDKIASLAFCSGSYLKREGRQIPLPSDIWKELISAPTGFSDNTIVFDDDLGLPRSLELYTRTRQPVFQYRVPLSTNVLGWNFPLEFYLAQYRPAGTNGWELHLTGKGKVTAIGPGAKPEFPTEVEKAPEK